MQVYSFGDYHLGQKVRGEETEGETIAGNILLRGTSLLLFLLLGRQVF